MVDSAGALQKYTYKAGNFEFYALGYTKTVPTSLLKGAHFFPWSLRRPANRLAQRSIVCCARKRSLLRNKKSPTSPKLLNSKSPSNESNKTSRTPLRELKPAKHLLNVASVLLLPGKSGENQGILQKATGGVLVVTVHIR